MKKLLLILTLFFSLALVGCNLSSQEAQVSVLPASYDFGEIAQSEGTVSTTFLVKNEGGEELVINRLSTSCGCTEAKMDQSPIESGASREMTVTFDPMVHPDQYGSIERVVYLQTSDSENPEIEINLMGNVVQ